MKNILLLFLLLASLFSCSGKSGFKGGQSVVVSEKCIGAIDEDSYDEMTRMCVNKDERGLEIMESRGLIEIINSGESAIVTKAAFGKVKIRLSSNDREYWCADQFIK